MKRNSTFELTYSQSKRTGSINFTRQTKVSTVDNQKAKEIQQFLEEALKSVAYQLHAEKYEDTPWDQQPDVDFNINYSQLLGSILHIVSHFYWDDTFFNRLLSEMKDEMKFRNTHVRDQKSEAEMNNLVPMKYYIPNEDNDIDVLSDNYQSHKEVSEEEYQEWVNTYTLNEFEQLQQQNEHIAEGNQPALDYIQEHFETTTDENKYISVKDFNAICFNQMYMEDNRKLVYNPFKRSFKQIFKTLFGYTVVTVNHKRVIKGIKCNLDKDDMKTILSENKHLKYVNSTYQQALQDYREGRLSEACKAAQSALARDIELGNVDIHIDDNEDDMFGF